MVELQDVSFSYTKKGGTLTHVDLTIRPGECVLLCGASGCGKTTITKLVNGLIPAFTEDCILTGQVLLHGAPVREQPLYQLARQVGSVFQNPKSQFFNMDSDSELAFGLENQGMTRGEILRRLDDTTDRLHLKRLRGRNIFAMSGGEKQLLAFASVYAMGPELYILDEPTANLDRDTIDRLHDQIVYLKSRGHTILIAEHRLYFLADLIDRAVYLRDGVVEQIWSGAEFRRLAETERIALGLRTLTPTQVILPPSRAAGEQDGLSVEGLCCRYKREPPIFQNLSFSTRPGEVLAVTGDNGVGKSTLSRCLCGLMRESAGTIRLNGRILGAKQRQRIAYCVMQDVNHQLFSDSVWGECRLATLFGVPGFYRDEDGRWTMAVWRRGIMIPGTYFGKIQGFQIRLDNKMKKGGKFLTFSSRDELDGAMGENWCHLVGPVRERILLIEGYMKADIVNHFTGQTILAVPGVTSLQHLEAALRDLIPLGVRHVTTCFDMDYLKNWHVENAYKNLVALLGKMDITFGTYLWVPDHNGLDDYIWDFCLNRGESSK